MNLPDLRGQRVLITGGLGFIGSNLAHKCLDLGAKVTIYDCLDPASGGNLFNVEGIKHLVELVYDNVLNLAGVSEHIANKNIIFNCAASTSHPFSMRMPFIDNSSNTRGTLILLEAARRFNPGINFVHVGTSTQLGPLQYSPADEKHPEFPTDIYSASKSTSEKYVLVYSRAHGIPTVAVRLPNVYGPRACINSPEFTFVNYFIGLALQDKKLTVYKPGDQMRNVLFVEDAVNALILASQHCRPSGTAYFAVGDEHFSVLDIAKMIVGNMGGSVQLVDWPQERESIEVGHAILSNGKIRDEIGWAPEFSFRKGLSITKTFFSSSLEKYLC
jgi:UDP-glucose 4-epimerase